MTKTGQKIFIAPTMRFKQYSGNWVAKRIDQITERVADGVEVEKEILYQQIGIRSHGKGIFHKEPIKGKELGEKRVFWVKENMLIVNIVFAWEHAVAKTTNAEVGMIASHRFPMYKAKEGIVDVDFLVRFFLTNKGKYLLGLASPGGAGRNKTLGQKTFNEVKIKFPSLPEQQKIASFLSAIDEKIRQLTRRKELLEQYKKGVMQQLFSGKLRFKDGQGKAYPKWEEKKLGEILDYIQPTKYLVESTEYNDSYPTPVLTAGKTFILGYTNETKNIYNESLPVIIFDDFTTATQFVNFPFKAKSSAMKILVAKKNANITFIYEAMQLIKFEIGGHGRHWISQYSLLTIPYPCLAEQQKIASFLSSLDTKIESVSAQIEGTQRFKKGLLQKMFV